MTPSINSLPELARQLRSGELPLTRYIEQLQTHFESREPSVLAYMPEPNRFERLQRDAESLLKKFPTSDSRPPLFGIPIGVKDIFHVDGFPTSGGSKLPPEILKGQQAESVTLLKNAGALIFGKAVSTEFAYFGPGPTRNPHNPEHTPGGSSSGSAAAIGANLNPLTLGTQTIGSIIRPASFCGVVGFKPTYDRISRDGSRPPLFGIPEGVYLSKAEPTTLEHFRATCKKLSEAGYTIKSVEAMPDFEDIYERHYVIVAAEAAQVHTKWFAEYGSLYHSKTVELIQRGRLITPDQLHESLAGREKLCEELTLLMDQNKVDLWIAPSAIGSAPTGLDSTGNPVMNLPWTQAGMPSLSLPSGLLNGLPLGLQLVARLNHDEELLVWGQGVEQALR
ncbi:MAG: amidase [Chloroflexi bacterium]|nr:amidase [Chloroflexota bacterium]